MDNVFLRNRVNLNLRLCNYKTRRFESNCKTSSRKETRQHYCERAGQGCFPQLSHLVLHPVES